MTPRHHYPTSNPSSIAGTSSFSERGDHGQSSRRVAVRVASALAWADIDHAEQLRSPRAIGARRRVAAPVGRWSVAVPSRNLLPRFSIGEPHCGASTPPVHRESDHATRPRRAGQRSTTFTRVSRSLDHCPDRRTSGGGAGRTRTVTGAALAGPRRGASHIIDGGGGRRGVRRPRGAVVVHPRVHGDGDWRVPWGHRRPGP